MNRQQRILAALGAVLVAIAVWAVAMSWQPAGERAPEYAPAPATNGNGPVVNANAPPPTTNAPSGPTGGCIISGCSGQVCADEQMMTTCEYRQEYACYRTARCERQADGTCGWTPSSQLTACLQSPPAL